MTQEDQPKKLKREQSQEKEESSLNFKRIFSSTKNKRKNNNDSQQNYWLNTQTGGKNSNANNNNFRSDLRQQNGHTNHANGFGYFPGHGNNINQSKGTGILGFRPQQNGNAYADYGIYQNDENMSEWERQQLAFALQQSQEMAAMSSSSRSINFKASTSKIPIHSRVSDSETLSENDNENDDCTTPRTNGNNDGVAITVVTPTNKKSNNSNNQLQSCEQQTAIDCDDLCLMHNENIFTYDQFIYQMRNSKENLPYQSKLIDRAFDHLTKKPVESSINILNSVLDVRNDEDSVVYLVLIKCSLFNIRKIDELVITFGLFMKFLMHVNDRVKLNNLHHILAISNFLVEEICGLKGATENLELLNRSRSS